MHTGLALKGPPTGVLALGAVALLFLPLQKFAEQRLTLLLREIRRWGALVLQEGGKIAACDLRSHGILWPNTTQHLLRDTPAGPAGNGRCKIDVAPFGMTRRLAKLIPLGEKAFDEA